MKRFRPIVWVVEFVGDDYHDSSHTVSIHLTAKKARSEVDRLNDSLVPCSQCGDRAGWYHYTAKPLSL